MLSGVFQSACLRMVGLPYRWGGDDPMAGFDCSGLAQELLAMAGLDPKGDQTAQGLHDYFKESSIDNIKRTGTLYFYGKSVSEITHVAVGVDMFTLIEAGGGGSKTTSLDAAIAQNAFIRLRPYDHRGDLVAILNPPGYIWNKSNAKG